MNKLEVHAYLKKEIIPKAKLIHTEHAAVEPKVAELGAKLNAAIQAKDDRTTRLLIKAFSVQVKRHSDRLNRTTALLELIEKIEPGEDFADVLKEIESVNAPLSKLEDELTAKLPERKVLEDKANDFLEKPADAATKATRGWAEVQSFMAKQLEDMKQRVKDMEAADQKKTKALADRDEKALQEAIAKATDLRGWKPGPQAAEDQVEAMTKKFDLNALSKDLQEQFKREWKKWSNDLWAMQVSKLVQVYVNMKDLTIKLVDVKKAAALLKVPAPLESELGKALKLAAPEMSKSLDALGKKLKPPTNAKAMIAALKSGKLL